MPFAPRDKARLFGLLGREFLTPVSEIKGRARPVAESRLAPLGIAETLLPEHALNILISMLAPTNVEAPDFVRDYLSFPCVYIGWQKSGPDEVSSGIRPLQLALNKRPLGEVLLAVLQDLNADVPAFTIVDEVWASWPPNEEFGVRLMPRGTTMPIDLVFAPEGGVQRRMKPHPERRLKHRVSFDASAIIAVSEFLTTLDRDHEYAVDQAA